MTETFLTLGPEALVTNDRLRDLRTDVSDLARLPNGTHVAVWAAMTGDGQQVWGARLSATGQPLGAPFRISAPETPAPGGAASGGAMDQWDPVVTARADGGFMVAWTAWEYSPLGSSFEGRNVVARHYAADGTPQGAPYALAWQENTDGSINNGSREADPGLTTLADGRIVLSFYDYEEGGFVLRFYGPDGQALLDEFAGPAALDYLYVSGRSQVTALEGGGFVLSWLAKKAGASFAGVYEVYTQTFDASGLPQGPVQLIDPEPHWVTGPRVSALADGGYVLSWAGMDAAAGSTRVRVQLFDADGSARGAALSLPGASYQGGADTAPLPDGGFVAIYQVVPGFQDGVDWTFDGLVMQRFAADGTPVGAAQEIATAYQPGNEDHHFPRVAAAPDGTIVLLSRIEGTRIADPTPLLSRSFHAAELDGVPTPGDDAIVIGTPGAPVSLLDGDDWLFGSDEGDTVYAGAGDDTLRGAGGDDLLGGADGQDSLVGDAGDDALWGVAGNDTLEGGPGNDTLGGGTGDDRLDGGAGDDDLWGSAGADTLLGGDGADMLGAAVGDDSLEGGAGDDALWGGQDNDTLLGGDGADTLGGFTGNDSLDGGGDADAVWGADGVDTLRGGDGNDQIGAGAGDDLAHGDAGDDTVSGGLGRDTVLGGTGDDLIFGGAGDDSLTGGAGNDTLYAGPGLDVVAFGAGDGADALLYFSVADDRLQLDAALWGGGMTAAQVVAAFGADAGADYILDFGGGDSLLLTGMVGITGLEGQIDIV